MQLTRAADYAVRIMIHLAMAPAGSRHQKADLAEVAEVPEHFVSKVLQSLKRSRLIESQRGMNGGFRLSRRPEKVTMLEVVEAVQGPMILNLCLSPGPSCDRKGWWPAHKVWVEAQAAMVAILDDTTIASLAAKSRPARIARG